MPRRITDACDAVRCGACLEICPVDCISEGDRRFEIDADACIDCGACEPACPSGAVEVAAARAAPAGVR